MRKPLLRSLLQVPDWEKKCCQHDQFNYERATTVKDFFTNNLLMKTLFLTLVFTTAYNAVVAQNNPGCVNTNLKVWFKADDGILTGDGSSVSSWTNKSSNPYNLTQSTAGQQPKYYSTTASKLVNFNPTLDFDGLDDHLKNLTPLMASNSPYTFLGVGLDEDASTGYRALFSSEKYWDHFILYKQNGAPSDNGWVPYAIGGISDRGLFGKGTKYSIAGGSNGFWNGTNFTSNASTDVVQPSIVGLSGDNTLGTGSRAKFFTYTDGYKDSPGWSPTDEGATLYQSYLFQAYAVGADMGANGVQAEVWKGRIPEVLAYDRQLTDAEMARVNTYLAIKYGVTLGQGNGAVGSNNANYDYVAGDGTVIWTATSNTGYKYNIAGIGRDDCQGLYQKQSKSVRPDEVVTISGGTAISTTNSNNDATLADKSFLLWGSNNLTTNYGISYTPTSYTPAGGYFRMSRVWKVQEVGTVGAVILAVAQGKHLLVSNDPTFASGVTEVALTADGNGNLTASYNFTSGQYFTFGNEIYSPGCVAANLKTWYKADAGFSLSDGASVSQWNDQSFTGFNVAQTLSFAQPTFYNTTTSKLVNFNPSLSFDGGDELKNLTRLYDNTSGYSLIGIGVDRRDVNAGGWRAYLGVGVDGNYPAMDFQNDGYSPNGWNPWMSGSGPAEWTGGSAVLSPYSLTNNTPNIAALTSANTSGGADNIISYVNGFKESTTLDSYQSNGFNQIGNGLFVGSSGDAQFIGLIPEIITYDRQLTDTEMQKVQSYLGIKYGTTIASDYLRGDGTKIWDKTANAAYHFDVAGIGHDECQLLNQRQSKSQDSDDVVTISGGTAISATNATNDATLADKSFMIWGNNNLSTSFGTAYAPNSYTPTSGYYRMPRVWKVQETGTIGSVIVSPNSGKHLLVSTDPTFAPANVTEIALTTDANGNLTASYNFTSGQYFTFGNEAPAPGCVAGGNIRVWLKADAGISVADGAGVSTWNDQSLFNYDVAQATAGQQPKYYATTAAKLVNFNPTLDFDGIDDHLKNLTPLMPSTSPYTFMGVGLDEAADLGYRALFSSEQFWDHFILYKQNGAPLDNGWIPYAIGGLLSDRGTFGKGTKYSIAGGSNGFWNGTNFTSNSTTDIVQPQIVGMSGNNVLGTTSRTSFFTYTDGYKDSPGNWSPTDEGVALYQSYLFKSYAVGADMGVNGVQAEVWKGRIPEVIAYDRQLTDAEMAKVNTYFGIKYGITLGQGNGAVGSNNANYDYVRGDGTVIWSATANTAYKYNIAGIGHDECQGLIQKQSKSARPDEVVTISAGASIAATNVANNANLADKSFLVWGSNNLSTTYATAYTPSSFTPAGAYSRMARVWKVQETGTIGTVIVGVPSGKHLLVSTSPTFASGVTEIPLTADANGNMTASYDFTSGQYFTFGSEAFAPGCVAPNLKLWLKADASGTAVGANATSWKDNSLTANDVEVVGTMTLQAGDAAHNYNPFFGNFSSTNFFKDMNSSLAPENAFQASEVTMIAAIRPTTAGTGRIFGIDNDDNFSAEPGFSLSNGKPNYYRFWNTTKDFTMTSSVVPSQSSVVSARTNGTEAKLWLNGTSETSTVVAGSGLWGDILTVGYGTWNINGAFPGDIQEVIWYKGVLTDIEVQKVQSYLAIKYGTTLSSDYLSATGIKLWDKTANATFHNNVFGIGREDCDELNQKQSTSTSSSILTIGIDTTIAASNLANTGTINKNHAFLMIGDNNVATGTVTTIPASECVPESVDKVTSRIWQAVETDTVETVKVSVDLSSFGFNSAYPVYMQVSSTSSFTSYSNILMKKNGTNYEANYNFNGTQYFRFAGNTLPLPNLCTGDKVYDWNLPTFWNWGQKTRTSTIGDQTFTVTITDPTNSIFIPTIYPVGQYWWDHIFIPRYDANGTNNKITTKIAMTKPASKASFEIFDMDEYFGKDVVNVYGKLAGVQVNPKFTFPSFTALSASGNKVTATTGVWDISSPGRVFVDFASPVDEIYIEYTKTNGWAFKSYQDLRIRNINVTCKTFVPEVPVVDNIYIAKQVTTASPKVDEAFTYKFTVKNLDCDAKTIDFTDILPAGLTWVDSTLTTAMSYSSVSNYGGGSKITLTGLTVPAGDSYIYIDAIGKTAGTYNNQASFVTNGNTYYSDEPTIAGSANPTPVTLVANAPLANLTFNKTVNKAMATQNEVVKYTYTITNPNATAVLTTFQDNLPASTSGSMTYEAGTLTGIGAGVVSPTNYGGESSIVIRNLSVPANGTLTFTVDANTGTFASGQTAVNVASVTPDPTSGFRQVTTNSTSAGTTISNLILGVGTIDCSKTQISPAPVSGVAGQMDLIVTLNVTTAGPFTPLAVTGSGFSLANGITSVTATKTGLQTFHIPVNYDGSTLTNNLQFTVGNAGTCTADMTKPAKVVSKNIYSLDGCSAVIPGVLTK